MDRAVQMGLRAHRLYPLLSRIRDVCISAVVLVAGFPFFLVLGVVARLSTGASALFHQTRVGRDGRHFRVEKFRTLPPDAPGTGLNKEQSANTATPAGRLMRQAKLDELPQFWNVLKGDMSLVGPRPIIPDEYAGNETPLRLAVRPGLTGLWQLSRVREQPFDKNPEYDLFYLANRSIVFDMWLVWRTVLLILTGRETKIRLAARIWERNPAWRQLVPDRARSIPQRSGPLRSRIYLVATAAVSLLFVAPGIGVAVSAKSDLLDAQSAMVRARRATAQLETRTAVAELEIARLAFKRSDDKLSSWPTSVMALVPGLNNNLEVPRTFAAMGSSLVEAGRSGLDILATLPTEDGRIAPPLNGGVLELAPFVAAEVPARNLQIQLQESLRELNASPDRFLIPSVADARRRGIALLSEAKTEADTALGALFLVPRLFGADGPRTWVIGAENNAELRGRGGYIGSLGTLTAEAGRMELTDFQPTSNLPPLPADESVQQRIDPEYVEQYLALDGSGAWQNLLMSPDFPTGARMLLGSLEAAANMPADGLIALDPIALSYLLRATGPVEVPGIPEPLTSENIVEWSLNKVYFSSAGANDERRELLSEVATTVWDRLLAGPNLNAQAAAMALTQAMSERHLVLYSTHPEEQKVIEQLGIGGSVDSTDNDYLLLLGQNVAENKMDYYLTRDIDFTGVLQDDGSLDVSILTTVRNTAPVNTEIPGYVSGVRPDYEGRTRDFMALFVPARAEVRDFQKDGKTSIEFSSTLEQGKRRLGTYVDLAPGASQTFAYRYRVPDALTDGAYRLNVQNQATVTPDTLTIQIQLPERTTVTERKGFPSGTPLLWEGPLASDMELSARVQTPLGTRIFDKVTGFLRKPVAGG
jgi:lipopolysaccharide/colanic/teichoic acid biosynthesis glycosyltransferase